MLIIGKRLYWHDEYILQLQRNSFPGRILAGLPGNVRDRHAFGAGLRNGPGRPLVRRHLHPDDGDAGDPASAVDFYALARRRLFAVFSHRLRRASLHGFRLLRRRSAAQRRARPSNLTSRI